MDKNGRKMKLTKNNYLELFSVSQYASEVANGALLSFFSWPSEVVEALLPVLSLRDKFFLRLKGVDAHPLEFKVKVELLHVLSDASVSTSRQELSL